MKKITILFILLFIASSLSATDLNIQIGQSTDDAGHNGFTFGTAELGITMGTFITQDNFEGLRFDNVTIPQSATIVSCSVEVRARITNTANPVMNFYFEDTADATTFSTSTDLQNRTQTTATLQISSWTDWVDNTRFQFDGDFKNLLQEVVDRGDWNSGQAVVFLGIVDASNSDNINLAYDAYDQSPSFAAILQVVYTVGVATNIIKVQGVHLKGVSVGIDDD